MLDTKLKKSHKRKNLIIALIVLIPALILVCLYPAMESAMLDKKEQWYTEWELQKEEYELERATRIADAEMPEQEETKEIEEEPEVEENVQIVQLVDTAEAATEEITVDADVSAAEAEQETFYLQDNFVNYAMEACYYQYAMLLQDVTGQEVFTGVLEDYGWINDYYEFTETTPYYVEYVHPSEDGLDVTYSTAVEEIWADLSQEEAIKLFW